MRRPPDDKTLSERDVDSSNVTLNALFGTKKSWMTGTGTGAPVRPTPRTSISRASLPQLPQVASTQRNAAAVLPSPAPSDEPSPVLSNSSNNVNNKNRLPSLNRESRSSIASQPQAIQIGTSTSRVSRNSQTRIQSPTSAKRKHNQAQAQAEARRPPSSPLVSRQQATTEKPPESAPGIGSEGILRSPSLSPPVELPPQPYQFQPTHVLVEPPLDGFSPEVSKSSFRPAAQYNQTLQQNRMLQNQAPASAYASNLASGSTQQLPPRLPVSQGYTNRTSPTYPHKRQRTQPAIMPSLKPRKALIDAHIASIGGWHNLNTGLERPRFTLLCDACESEDSFYIALHQIFCLWDTSRIEILRVSNFPDENTLQEAFKSLAQLIRDNDQLAPNHKRWFATFPSPLPDLLKSSEPYRQIVAQVGVFLARLATHWNSLSMEFNERKYPPLVDELVDRLFLLSPTLQGVVFSATRRNIGLRDGPLSVMMEETFKKDQKGHQLFSARVNTDRPPGMKEVYDRNNGIRQEYLKIYAQYVQQQQFALNSRIPTPVVPSNALAQPRPPQVLPNDSTGRAIAASAQSQWHHPGHPSHGQALQRPSSNSPNPNLMTRPPPSVGAQHIFPQNMPSPTLLQGLAVGFPVQSNFDSSNIFQIQQPQNVSFPPGVNPSLYQRTASTLDQQSQSPSAAQQMAAQQRQQLVQQNQQAQQAILLQQQAQQQQQVLNQGIASMNRAAQRQAQQQQVLNQGIANMGGSAQRRGSNIPTDMQQQFHSRDNSISSAGRNAPIINNMPRPQAGPSLQHAFRPTPPQPYNQEQEKASILHYSQLHPYQRPLVPPSGYTHPQQPTNPDTTALHQAHLRSPRLVAMDAGRTQESQVDPAHRYYQVVKRFALEPTRISSSVPLSRFDFNVPAVDHASIPKDFLQAPGQVLTRQFKSGSLQYRLRCVQLKKHETKCPISEWVIRDTVWPETAALSFYSASVSKDEYHLEIRKKNHHGKDLPIDITRFVHAAGPDSKNRITLSIPKGRTKMKDFSYFVAVEVVDILQHSEIVDIVQQHHIPADVTLDKIKKSMAGPTNADGDDDFAMVTSDLALELADPFTARIFEIPVRGKTCLHRECFDLMTFLLTRNSKMKRPEQPCMIDVWKCPLCQQDARPYSLQIDDFLVQVRDALGKSRRLDTKAIWIRPDGTWHPKHQERTGTADDSDDSEDEPLPRKNKALEQNKNKKIPEIIELDD